MTVRHSADLPQERPHNPGCSATLFIPAFDQRTRRRCDPTAASMPPSTNTPVDAPPNGASAASDNHVT
jgi:hypothetical protein